MIQVDRLSKRFGSYQAVDCIHFEVGRGEIVGLLGPNGAGKTTTMRMLTTYLSPTSGRAALAGHDVLDEPLAVRRKVGYLPENVPLYTEMRVTEYLRYRCRLKDVPRGERRRAVGEVVSRCRLGDVENRIIGQLSRGFRQRVGLADAMVHDPEILILDEPTAGLDPLQIREVRTLIGELGLRHTILLSTHILSEVEAVCGRVIIIARGRIALDDQLTNLRRQSAVTLEARGPVDPIRAALQTIPGVERVVLARRDGDHACFEIQTRDSQDLREVMSQKLMSNGWPLRQLDLRRSSLEERFTQVVTQHTLADAQARGQLIMRHVLPLFYRELAAYFLGPMAYLVLLAFQFIAILNFWELVDTLSLPQRELSSLRDPMSTYISGSPAFWIAILVAVPMLTMRLFAEERRSGTIEALLTVPVTETEVVVAKWLAGVVMFIALLVPFALYLPFLNHQASFDFDVGPILTLGLGLTTMGMMFTAIGLLSSALSRNQIVAAIWTFSTLFVLLVIFPVAYLFAARQHVPWAEGLRFIAVLFQIQSFGLGQLDLRYVALHVSVCIFVLSLTVKAIETRTNR